MQVQPIDQVKSSVKQVVTIKVARGRVKEGLSMHDFGSSNSRSYAWEQAGER